jgi:hypothetical protein
MKVLAMYRIWSEVISRPEIGGAAVPIKKMPRYLKNSAQPGR